MPYMLGAMEIKMKLNNEDLNEEFAELEQEPTEEIHRQIDSLIDVNFRDMYNIDYNDREWS